MSIGTTRRSARRRALHRPDSNGSRPCSAAADLRQSDLAERAGLHQTAISHLELGKRGTTQETLAVLADVLGCDVTDLLPDKAAA